MMLTTFAKHSLLTAGVATVIGVTSFVGADSAQAAVIFNGGAPNLASGNEMTSWIQAEDFILDANTQITGARFWTIESPGEWDGTLSYFLFADNGGKPANTFFAFGQGVDVNKQATGNSAYGLSEYSYSFDLANPVNLLANVKYWFGLHLAADYNSRDEVYWETTGTGFGLNGQESYGGNLNSWYSNGQQHAFQLTNDSQAIPTPALLPGLIGVGVAAIRKRKAEAVEEASEA